jgi:uncharacterized protein (DUF736 family)
METKNNNYEIKNNSGSLFKNENATGNQPTYRGKVKVNNVEMDVSLWVKESAKGTKYFSASFQEPFVKPTTTEPNVKINNIDDDLPF